MPAIFATKMGLRSKWAIHSDMIGVLLLAIETLVDAIHVGRLVEYNGNERINNALFVDVSVLNEVKSMSSYTVHSLKPLKTKISN